jgi:hypothetical protein
LQVWQQELPELSCIEITAIAVMMSGFFVSGGKEAFACLPGKLYVSQFYFKQTFSLPYQTYSCYVKSGNFTLGKS